MGEKPIAKHAEWKSSGTSEKLYDSLTLLHPLGDMINWSYAVHTCEKPYDNLGPIVQN